MWNAKETLTEELRRLEAARKVAAQARGAGNRGTDGSGGSSGGSGGGSSANSFFAGSDALPRPQAHSFKRWASIGGPVDGGGAFIAMRGELR